MTEKIRGLERGLLVLQVLQETPIASLQQIHTATEIPKPSLLRILGTLQSFGLVSRRLADGHYRLNTIRRAARARDPHDRVAEAAAPVLDRLFQKVSLPSDLFVPAGICMERRESSRSQGQAVRFPRFLGPPVGTRANWLLTALGRVYLAFCPDKEREQIIARLRKSDQPEDQLARHPKQVEKILAETRTRGYGLRAPTFPGGAYGRPQDDGLAGMAVPLWDGQRVYGCINILWVRTSMTTDECARRHLADLQAAASEIVATLNA